MDKPNCVSRAAALWSIAVGAGVAESALAVTEIAGDGGLSAGIWADLALRVLVYTGAAVLIVHFAQGRRWARWSLAGLLSVIGLAAMVVPSVSLMADGEPFLSAFGSTGPLAVPFLAVRLLHIAALLGATAFMFTPSANRYFASPKAAPAMSAGPRS